MTSYTRTAYILGACLIGSLLYFSFGTTTAPRANKRDRISVQMSRITATDEYVEEIAAFEATYHSTAFIPSGSINGAIAFPFAPETQRAWFRLEISGVDIPTETRDGLLDIGWPLLESATLFQKKPDQTWRSIECHAGSGKPFWLSVHLRAGESFIGYLCLEGNHANAFPLSIFTPEAVSMRTARIMAWRGGGIGILLFLAVLGLYCWRIDRDRPTLWHSLFVLCATLCVATESLPLNEWMGSTSLRLVPYAAGLFIGLAMLFGCLFTRSFLDLSMGKMAGRIITYATYLALLLMPLLPFIMPSHLHICHWGWLMGFAMLFAATGTMRITPGQSSILFFTLGWLALAAGIGIQLLTEIHIIPYSPLAAYSIGIGLLTEAILIFLAQSRRFFATLHRDHEIATHAKEQEADMSHIFEGIHSGIALVDKEHNILFSNPSMGEMVESLAPCPSGKCHRALFGEECICEDCPLAEVIESGRPIYRILTKTRSDLTPSLRVIQSTTSPIPDRITGEIDRVLIEFRDLTDQLEIEAQLHQTEKLSAIGQLAGGVAHDFNNQLTIIQGYADMLLADEITPQARKDALEKIHLSAQRSADLTRQLLTFSRKAASKRELLDLHQLIGETIRLLSRSLDKKITMEQKLEAKTAIARGDQSQLQNAFLNLALNARDAMPDGGTLCFSSSEVILDEETATLASYDTDPGNYIEIGVADTGCGMSRDILAHIFEPFFTTKEIGKGTGMGLAAVYGTVKTHGGYILCESRPEKGTRFLIGFPKVESDLQQRRESGTTVMAKNASTIMLIDDEPDVAGATGGMLQRLGYQVQAYQRGAEAIEAYRTNGHVVDLVLLDMIMPEMDGGEVFDALQEINPNIRVLLMSGYSLTKDIQRLRAAGAIGFIEKPFEFANLSRVIRNAMAGNMEE